MGSVKSGIRDIFIRAYPCIAAGALGGLCQSLLIWLVGQLGFFIAVRLPLAPELTLPWLYRRIVWGGLWGLVFLLPVLRRKAHWKRGLLLGLLPAAATLFYFLPFKDGLGYLGLALGTAMPAVVILFGLIWGQLAGFWLDRVTTRPQQHTRQKRPKPQ